MNALNGQQRTGMVIPRNFIIFKRLEQFLVEFRKRMSFGSHFRPTIRHKTNKSRAKLKSCMICFVFVPECQAGNRVYSYSIVCQRKCNIRNLKAESRRLEITVDY